ncbi:MULTISPECIES: GH92 family glycosyl hydrolase [Catenuloplanes]|uniref:Alpha-1,2-mannosidase n=1 Tax=Catenuloplanes niger TaxID=587534 RepID=A0AAE4A043_9ACTN|nr:GH92 family glycosyl hydrolase [Catenuloplanes niger]MDR7328217.1 putative alpha-1,2-mannosidase [Catenuloplanes niger]
MRRRTSAGALAVALLASAVGTVLAPAAGAAEPIKLPRANLTPYVDPFIGTGFSSVAHPVPGGRAGNTLPGPVLPFGMVQLSPDSPTASPSGYRHDDVHISQFSLTHLNGAGCANSQDIGILPLVGDLTGSPGTTWTSYRATRVPAKESAEPGYYQTTLRNADATETVVETTATERTAAMRMRFPRTTAARVLLNSSRSATGNRDGAISISGNTVTGTVTGGGFCEEQEPPNENNPTVSSETYKIFYRIEFDRAPSSVGTWHYKTVSPGVASVSGVRTGGYLTFDTRDNDTVEMRVGISFVDPAGAAGNLTGESANRTFSQLRTAAHDRWNDVLNRIRVGGGTPDDLTTFYTALYHVMVNPNLASDRDGRYRGYDDLVHTATHPVYQNFSGWDIYRSWASLIAMVAPNEAGDMAKSLVLAGQQGGLLPKWGHAHNENYVMPGDPGPIVVAALRAFGVRNFDTAAALDLMDRNANGDLMQGKPIRGDQADYVARRYVPGNAATSLEYSASDFAVAQYARSLGDTARYDRYIERAQWWRNVYNPVSGYLQARNADGTWAARLDPAFGAPGNGYAEGNASQYTWMVPYDYRGLIALMGGPQTAVQRLDHHFTQLNGGLSAPYFYMGNEPEHGTPWIYHYAGVPARTSAVVRRVMTETFNSSPGGLPGNDDLGSTSAWYVWAALGMYPVTPGSDVLALHGPLFPRIVISRASGDLEISAPGAGRANPYVQGVTLQDAAVTRSWLRYSDLFAEIGIGAGRSLTYTMGASPSAWGTNPADVPPSVEDGAAPVPPAPDLGPNLAAGRPATGAAVCAAGEEPARAFDGDLGTKWCAKGTVDPTLRVDLGGTRDVTGFVLKNAGLGGEATDLNTRGYTIATSVDGITWTTAVSASGMRDSRTYHPVTAVPARHVRLTVTEAGHDDAARIPEFEVYGPVG